MVFKIIVTGIFSAVFFIRLFMPGVNIDTTSIILIVLAFVPWFIQYIKSLEITGIGKIEFNKEKLQRDAAEAGFKKPEASISEGTKYSFYNLRYEDPKLALAGLRIEIENSLRKIAEKNKIDISRGGIGQITDVLSKHELITGNERALIYDITKILNKAVHSQLTRYDSGTFDWVFDLGLNILESLNSKLQ